MGIFIAILATLTNPTNWIIGIMLLLWKRSWYMVIVGAVLIAITNDTLLTLMSPSRAWGRGLVLHFLGGIVSMLVLKIFFRKNTSIDVKDESK